MINGRGWALSIFNRPLFKVTVLQKLAVNFQPGVSTPGSIKTMGL